MAGLRALPLALGFVTTDPPEKKMGSRREACPGAPGAALAARAGKERPAEQQGRAGGLLRGLSSSSHTDTPTQAVAEDD